MPETLPGSPGNDGRKANPLDALMRPGLGYSRRADYRDPFKHDVLYETRGWSFCLDLWPYRFISPSEWSNVLFLPTQQSRVEMARLSVQYPYLIKAIDDAVDFAKRMHARLAAGEDAEDDLDHGIEFLADRVRDALSVIDHDRRGKSGHIASLATAHYDAVLATLDTYLDCYVDACRLACLASRNDENHNKSEIAELAASGLRKQKGTARKKMVEAGHAFHTAVTELLPALPNDRKVWLSDRLAVRSKPSFPPKLDEEWPSPTLAVPGDDEGLGWVYPYDIVYLADDIRVELRRWALEVACSAASAAAVADSNRPAVKAKRSTARGDAAMKLVAALSKHHQYSGGGCLNLEPMGVQKLSRTAKIAASTVSKFFEKNFGNHAKYISACMDPPRLGAALKLLNGEFSPQVLLGDDPLGTQDKKQDD